MSAYKNFVHDFPMRCSDLLRFLETEALELKLEVTLMLAIASVGLVVPFERLRTDKDHPSQDQKRFKKTATKLAQLIKERFGDSQLNTVNAVWRYAETATLIGEPDHWRDFGKRKSADGRETRTILLMIRNALAHGNVWSNGDPISELVFACEKAHNNPAAGYKYVTTSPVEFKHLLLNWFDFLKQNDTSLVHGAIALELAA